MTKNFPFLILITIIISSLFYFSFIFFQKNTTFTKAIGPAERETFDIGLFDQQENNQTIYNVLVKKEDKITPLYISNSQSQKPLKLSVENPCNNSPETYCYQVAQDLKNQLPQPLIIVYQDELGIQYFTEKNTQGDCN